MDSLLHFAHFFKGKSNIAASAKEREIMWRVVTLLLEMGRFNDRVHGKWLKIADQVNG